MPKSTDSKSGSHLNQSSSRNGKSGLTSEARSQIPKGPSNVFMYLQRDEPWECITTGQASKRSEASTASELAEWETRWRAMGGQ